MIIKICNSLFHTFERNQAEENKSTLNNVMDSLKEETESK